MRIFLAIIITSGLIIFGTASESYIVVSGVIIAGIPSEFDSGEGLPSESDSGEGIPSEAYSKDGRTFKNCYNDSVNSLLEVYESTFYDFNMSLLEDSEFKRHITNFCNFYHEKTGIWIDASDDKQGNLTDLYANEFIKKYPPNPRIALALNVDNITPN